MNVLRNELCALKFRKKMHTKSEKISKKYFVFFINQDGNKCSHFFNSSVV